MIPGTEKPPLPGAFRQTVFSAPYGFRKPFTNAREYAVSSRW